MKPFSKKQIQTMIRDNESSEKHKQSKLLKRMNKLECRVKKVLRRRLRRMGIDNIGTIYSCICYESVSVYVIIDSVRFFLNVRPSDVIFTLPLVAHTGVTSYHIQGRRGFRNFVVRLYEDENKIFDPSAVTYVSVSTCKGCGKVEAYYK